ncbi:tetratricopeptide repeat protein, partial [Candidatus Electronema sp. TJ]|uniref:tetratricopeptide repeat protein n=1 Tax=Candidatus Electronema sp. TJ TaxID=3401573 RepID=UPI003AA7C9F0
MMCSKLLQKIWGSGNTVAGGNVTVTYNNSVIPPQRLEELAGKLAVTDSALASFFRIMEEQQVPLGDLDSKLREIATQYKELRARLENVQSADPEVQRLKAEAKQAIEAGDYAKAEKLLDEAEARDVQAFEQLEANAKSDMEAAQKRRISAAATNADQARLQRVQLRYAKAAAYWQKAAALLPDDKQQERSLYLHSAGYDLDRIAKYKEALALYEQSLNIRQEIGFKAGEAATLNNISQIYDAKGDYATALKYLEQSLRISRNIDDKEVEGATLNNIGLSHQARGDYPAALEYLEQSLSISREIGDKAGEGTTLNNISQIYDARGDYAAALKYLEQSLSIRREIGD